MNNLPSRVGYGWPKYDPPPSVMPAAKNKIVVANAIADPAYCPWCLRCPGMVRMEKVEPMLWRCSCGAVHDERQVLLAIAGPPTPADEAAEVAGLVYTVLARLPDGNRSTLANAVAAELVRRYPGLTAKPTLPGGR